MTLFQILSNGERFIVHSSECDQLIYTWNQSLTLQAWSEGSEGWEEVDIRTLSDEPQSFLEARDCAIEWDQA